MGVIGVTVAAFLGSRLLYFPRGPRDSRPAVDFLLLLLASGVVSKLSTGSLCLLLPLLGVALFVVVVGVLGEFLAPLSISAVEGTDEGLLPPDEDCGYGV